MPTSGDYYEALGVRRDATPEEIRKAYRRTVRACHPDVSTSPDAAARFAQVSQAYEVLVDPEKRRAYDRYGAAGVGAARAAPADASGARVDVADFGSFFEELFGRRGTSPFGDAQGRPAAPARGPDVTQTLRVSFMTAAVGGEERLRPGGAAGREAGTVTVRIPPGVKTGSRLRVRGRGESGVRGGPSGDLLLTLDVGAHPCFRREGLDIVIDVPITLAEAALGTTVRVPLLHGGSAELRVPAGAASGRRLRIRSKGVTDAAGNTGDFLAVVQIVAPASLSPRARRLVEELASELQNPRESPPWADTEDDLSG